MTSVQIRNVPDDLTQTLRDEARENGRSVRQQLPVVPREHTARFAPARAFGRVDAVFGAKVGITVDIDPAEAIRADRDERDARDAERAADYR
ncbi:MAG TPA: hypothetical protein VJT49_22975 [Amycolatopsis sp.]|uniref:FitA-like ribbon-helix-helix domain-containing protein n=1 Tax=Amycolatopsis sp. TaxID=37632 RepID=UPI002B4686E0|nr:hypothetical protein [Amycolatopsis sp.]HKS47920.1 hypothetical protein [Amycolatopsis sp.]